MTTSNGASRAPLQKVCITLPDDQLNAVDEMAAERRGNRSALIREAIDMYLRVNGRDPRLQPRSEQTVAVA